MLLPYWLFSWTKPTFFQGDSGGPLQILVEEPFCMYQVAGVTAFGAGCGEFPGVYTRVTDFLGWIEDIVWH